MLHVEVDEDAALFCEIEDGAEAGTEMLDGVVGGGGMDLGIEGGDFDGDVDLWDRGVAVEIELLDVGPGVGGVGQLGDQANVAVLVILGFLFAEDGFAEDIGGEGEAVFAQPAEFGDGGAGAQERG